LRGEPIVSNPQEAWRTFQASGMDALVVENLVVVKEVR
jgi:predicted NodU family carbamoyl transferase